MRAAGFEQDELIEKNNVIFAVRSVRIDYLSPARFNEELLVTTTVIKKGKASITVEQTIKRNETVICRAEIKIASLNANDFTPVAMPQNIYNKI